MLVIRRVTALLCLWVFTLVCVTEACWRFMKKFYWWLSGVEDPPHEELSWAGTLWKVWTRKKK